LKYIFSGISGVDKQTACRELQKIKISSEKEVKVKIIHLEEILKEISGLDDITILLNSYNWDYQKRAWISAFEEAIKMEKEGESDITILCMHLIYLRNNRYFSPLDLSLLRDYSPDGFITLIDDIYLIKKRIMLRSEESAFKTDLHLRDIISWRSIELSLSDMLCSFLGEKMKLFNFILSVKQPVSTLYNIILNPTKLKIYIAHPITVAKNNTDLIEEIEAFKDIIHREFTVFDPTTIDERLLTYSLEEQYPDWRSISRGQLAELVVELNYGNRWPVNHEPILSSSIEELFPIEIDAEEIIDIGEAIDDHIQSRDYRLISQSDVMVAFRPNYKKRTSPGVLSEMHHARDVALKPCHMYFPESDGEREASPFRGGGFSYRTIEDLLESLRKHNEQLAKKL